MVADAPAPAQPKPLADANGSKPSAAKRRKKKAKKGAVGPAEGVMRATAASQRRRVAKFKDRTPPPPPPDRGGRRGGGRGPAGESRALGGSRSAPALRPKTASSSMGIPGDIAPRATSPTTLVRRTSGSGAPSRAWSAGEATFARRNLWYAVLTQAPDAARPRSAGLPSGRTPALSNGVGGARGEHVPHFQHCVASGRDDDDDDDAPTPRPTVVPRLKRVQSAPRLRSDLMFQRDAGFLNDAHRTHAYRIRTLVPIDRVAPR